MKKVATSNAPAHASAKKKDNGTRTGSTESRSTGFFRAHKKMSVVAVGVVVLALAIIIPVALRSLSAAGGAASFEAESGTRTARATVGTDTKASAGSFVTFTPPTGGGGGGCQAGWTGTSPHCLYTVIPSKNDPAFCRGVAGGLTFGDGHASGAKWTYNGPKFAEIRRCLGVANIGFTTSGNATTYTASWAPGGNYDALAAVRNLTEMQGWIIGLLYGEGGKGTNLVYDATASIVPNAAQHAVDVVDLFAALGAHVVDQVHTSASDSTHKLFIDGADLDVIRSAAGGPPNYPNAVDLTRIPGT